MANDNHEANNVPNIDPKCYLFSADTLMSIFLEQGATPSQMLKTSGISEGNLFYGSTGTGL